tara:strand:+ start:636 stop:818 length:183 start_codon:yes stop_codon:yes gene_type:complete
MWRVRKSIVRKIAMPFKKVGKYLKEQLLGDFFINKMINRITTQKSKAGQILLTSRLEKEI